MRQPEQSLVLVEPTGECALPGHTLHSLAPDSSLKNPLPQESHAEVKELAKLPAGHWLPARQSSSLSLIARENEPPSQDMHDVELNLYHLPAGQPHIGVDVSDKSHTDLTSAVQTTLLAEPHLQLFSFASLPSVFEQTSYLYFVHQPILVLEYVFVLSKSVLNTSSLNVAPLVSMKQPLGSLVLLIIDGTDVPLQA
jgi:hypothetical protein